MLHTDKQNHPVLTSVIPATCVSECKFSSLGDDNSLQGLRKMCMNRLVIVSTTDQLAFDEGHFSLGPERKKPHPVYMSVEPAEPSVHTRYHLELPEGHCL